MSTASTQATEPDFHAGSVIDTTAPLITATVVYFLALSAYIGLRFQQSEFGPPLLIQKLVYFGLALALLARVRSRRLKPRQVYPVMTTVLIVGLSSVVGSWNLGMRDNFPYNLCIPLLAVGGCSLSRSWSFFAWGLTWSVWLGLSWPLTEPSRLARELIFLGGAQTIAAALQYNRWLTSKRLFSTYQSLVEQSQQLEGALLDAERSRQRLDDLVEQRTRQLRLAYDELSLSLRQREEMQQASDSLQAQLLQSQKMESLGRLAGGVAHDFNNLLTVILGNLELAQTLQSEGADHQDLLQQAQIAARRAADVTGQLLAFSRKQVLRMKPLELKRVTRDSLRLMERLLGEDIQVEFQAIDSDLPICGDAGQLHQVLMNLIVNSRDAMPKGGVLKVQLESVRMQAADWAVVRVVDSGHGIPAEELPRIFEPFYTSKPFGKGTGLGLSTVHGIITQHQGEIQVQTKVGQGTTFSVFLPLLREPLQDSGSRQVQFGPGHDFHILLVEDDAQVRGLASRILRTAGYRVTTAVDGEDALKLVEQGLDRFHLLLTDVVMPQMDGARLAQELACHQPDFKVLFVSGYTDDRLAHFGIGSENLNFLPKPYTPIALCKKVVKVLQGEEPQVERPQSCRLPCRV